MNKQDIFNSTKKLLPPLFSKEQQGNDKYLFVVDNPSIAEGILMLGYNCGIVCDNEQLEFMAELFAGAGRFTTNVQTILCCSKKINDYLADCLGNQRVISDGSYRLYGSKKDYYKLNPTELEKPIEAFISSLTAPEVKDTVQRGTLVLNPQSGLIVASPTENPYRDIAAYVIKVHDIVLLNEELRYHTLGRFYDLFTPEVCDRILIKELDNSNARFRSEVYCYIKNYAPKKNLSKGLVPFLNCAYDYTEGDIKEYTEDMYFKRCIPHSFDIGYKNQEADKKINDFMDSIACHNKELTDLLWDMLAYCFAEGNPWQKTFFIYGTGGNGKGVFFSLLEYIFGKSSIAYKNWAELGTPTGRNGIGDKSLILCNDIDKSFVKEPQALKTLTSCEPQSAKQLYKDEYTVTFTGKIISSGNAVPKVNDTSNGWLRRLIVIPFEGDFRANPDTGLKDSLCNEDIAQTVIIYAMLRLPRVLEKGFKSPERVNELMEEYRLDNNPVAQFISEYGHYFTGRDNCKSLDVIYSTWYTKFCSNNGYKRLSKLAFAKTAKNEGLKKARPNGGQGWLYYLDNFIV